MIHQPFFIPAAAFVILAAPLVLGMVPRNRFYGVRTAKTLSDPGIWLRANRVGGLLLMAAGAIYLAAAALTPTADGKDLSLIAEHFAAFALPLVAAMLAGYAYIRKL